MVSTVATQERRQYRRFPAATINAQIKTKKGLFSESWTDVSVSDFSEHGIAIYTTNEPEKDQLITLKVVLEMDMGNITIESIDALVRNKVSQSENWRVGLEFVDEKSSSKQEQRNEQIARIIRILEKSSAVSQKLKKQVADLSDS